MTETHTVIIVSVVVLCAAISTISQTLRELNKFGTDCNEAMRELRRYFKDMGRTAELSCRSLVLASVTCNSLHVLDIGPGVL